MNENIIQQAQARFLQHGYSKIRLDEIATELAISKKTIYHYFDSKETLLYAVLEKSVQDFKNEIAEIENNSQLAFEEKVKKILAITGIYSTRTSVLVADLRRNMSAAYQKLIQIKKELVLNYGMRMLNEGISRGLIKDDWKTSLSLYMFMATAEKTLLHSFKETMPAELTQNLPDSHEGMLRAIVEIIYHGIKK